MRKLFTAILLIFGLALAHAAIGQDADAVAEAVGARKEKILANLKAKFPQLQQANVTMGALGPSPYGSLDEGSFTMTSNKGSQTQKFLVSNDDKALYMITSFSRRPIGCDEAWRLCASRWRNCRRQRNPSKLPREPSAILCWPPWTEFAAWTGSPGWPSVRE